MRPSMNITIIILIILIDVVIRIFYAFRMKEVAIQKGYGEDTNVWIICFFLGILGGMYVIALPDLILQSQNKQIIELLKER